MITWLAMGCVGLGSFALRFLPLLLAERVVWSEKVGRALRHAGTAALVFLTVKAALGAGRDSWPAAAGALAAMVVGLVLVARGHRPIVIVAAGLATDWLVVAVAMLFAR